MRLFGEPIVSTRQGSAPVAKAWSIAPSTAAGQASVGLWASVPRTVPCSVPGAAVAAVMVAASESVEDGGAAVLRRLWDRFRLSDAELAVALEEVEPELLRVPSDWPRAVGEVAP